MHRRMFLARAAQTAFATALIPFAGCARNSPRAAAAPKSGSFFNKLIAELRSKIPALMSEHNVPGASIAVIHDARIAWRSGFGLKNAATKKLVTDDTVFQAGSMSKPVFAYAALKLCEKGILGLDTPLSKFASEPFLTGDPRIGLITPRHILSHTAGFPNWRSQSQPLKINFAPGLQYKYSGEGYYYLQSVITQLLGRTDPTNCAKFELDLEVCASDIDQFLRANVLKPFGMRSSDYYLTDRNEKNVSAGHDNDGKPLPSSRPTGPAVTRYASAGALLTTPTDYAKFMVEILNPKPADNFRLRKETISEMLRPHTKVVCGAFTSSWALGWQIQDNGLFNHGGDNKGFHCHAIGSRESKSGFVIMTNGDQGDEMITKIFTSGILDPLFPSNG